MHGLPVLVIYVSIMQILRQHEDTLVHAIDLFFEEIVDCADTCHIDISQPLSARSAFKDQLVKITFTVDITGLQLERHLFHVVADEDHVR